MNARPENDPHADPAASAAPGADAAAEALRMVVSQIMGGAAPDAAAIHARQLAQVAQQLEPGGVLETRAIAPQARTPVQQAGAAADAVTLAGLPAVLPRLSEYRIAQVGKSAAAFEREQQQFWQSSNTLSALREEMTRLARERGVPLQDISDKMRPDGELAALRHSFNAAVAEAPAALGHKKAMDKALDSYTRQYGRAQEEILNPDLADNPHYDGLKQRLVQSHEAMLLQSAAMPGFVNASGVLEASHGAKLAASVEKINEKMALASAELMTMLRGAREAGPAGP